MNDILLYLGCKTPVRLLNYEAPTIEVFTNLERREEEGV